MKSFFFLHCLFFSCIMGYGQKDAPLKPLTVGSVFPDITLNRVINFSKPVIKLSEHQGKLIIFDFWSTNCSSCIGAFPKLELFQEKYKDKLFIVLVNSGDSKDKINKFYDLWEKKRGGKLKLPTLYSDTILNLLFPHKGIPHYGWVGTDGKVKAIAGGNEMREKHIISLIKNETTNIPLKRDIPDNRPLFSTEEMPGGDTLLHYSVFIKGQYDGLGNGTKLRYRNSKVYGFNSRNATILTLYERIFAGLYKDKDKYDPKRLVLNLSDTTLHLFKMAAKLNTESGDDDLGGSIFFDLCDNIGRSNFFTFEINVPINKADSLYYYALDELNKYSGFLGWIEKRKVKCLSLVRTSPIDKIKTNGGLHESRLEQPENKYLKNAPLSHLIARLNNIENNKLYVSDGTNYKDKIDIILNVDFNDFLSVKRELNKYDLDLVEVEKEIDMFIIKEK